MLVLEVAVAVAVAVNLIKTLIEEPLVVEVEAVANLEVEVHQQVE